MYTVLIKVSNDDKPKAIGTFNNKALAEEYAETLVISKSSTKVRPTILSATVIEIF